MYFVYILTTADGTFYIGQTKDIDTRMIRHQKGECKYTKSRLPVKLSYWEQFSTRSEAMRREKHLKSLKSHVAITKLIGSR